MINLRDLQILPYFTLETAMQSFEISENSARQLLSRWTKRGHILRLKRGYYMTNAFYLQHKNMPEFIALVAVIIQPHSYLTGAWVLQKHGVMTEGIYAVTAATVKHTRVITNPIATFYYTHIQEKLFTGYKETGYAAMACREATPAKALFDYFYFKTEPENIEGERLNLTHRGKSMQTEFRHFVRLSASPKMARIAKNLQKTVWA